MVPRGDDDGGGVVHGRGARRGILRISPLSLPPEELRSAPKDLAPQEDLLTRGRLASLEQLAALAFPRIHDLLCQCLRDHLGLLLPRSSRRGGS